MPRAPKTAKRTASTAERLAGMPILPDLVIEGGKRTRAMLIREGTGTVQPQLALWIDRDSSMVRAVSDVISPLRRHSDSPGGTGARLHRPLPRRTVRGSRHRAAGRARPGDAARNETGLAFPAEGRGRGIGRCRPAAPGAAWGPYRAGRRFSGVRRSIRRHGRGARRGPRRHRTGPVRLGGRPHPAAAALRCSGILQPACSLDLHAGLPACRHNPGRSWTGAGRADALRIDTRRWRACAGRGILLYRSRTAGACRAKNRNGRRRSQDRRSARHAQPGRHACGYGAP